MGFGEIGWGLWVWVCCCFGFGWCFAVGLVIWVCLGVIGFRFCFGFCLCGVF